jgi:putative restriction endonuclease
MPPVPANDLVSAITDAIAQSGYVAQLATPPRQNPRRFIVSGQNAPAAVTVYAWTLTFGGRPSLPNEYRIQMTSVESPLPLAADGPTVLLGYEPSRGLFAGFDLARHRTFTQGSPSIQIDISELRRAESDGMSFHRKSNDEIAIGFRPDMFMAYALNARLLHVYGRSAATRRLLTDAARMPSPPPPPAALSAERRRTIREVNRLSRDAAFRRRVMFAYGNRCAVTRVQLGLVDAAHILPVGAAGSTDDVQNGIALAPTYHRAFDAGIIYLTERLEMKLNEGRVAELRGLDLAGGVSAFRGPLGAIFLPPDPNQRPDPEFIRRCNRLPGRLIPRA